MKAALRKAIRWLHPGLRVKRWLVLLTAGVVAVSIGAMLFFNLRVFELMGSVGGPRRALAVGAIAIVLGLLAVVELQCVSCLEEARPLVVLHLGASW